ncbi:MAG: hypothetical protein LBO75_03445 [Bifidobacteriaceae bacterium]|jgi:hypothetical protein|nr:hypothetical protein [Bifidobacteriaceae bacterium]
MLHPYVLMADIDVDQWRAAQQLLLRSAKAARRIVVLHDQGKIVKLRHSQGLAIKGTWPDAKDPHGLAKALYLTNQAEVDFVQVVERDASDTYFGRIQDAWDPDQDLDVFVTNTYREMDNFPDGIVTYPGPARQTLGLQWRIGASHEEVEAVLAAIAKPGGTIVFGVIEAGRLWASLILDIASTGQVGSVTTADPAAVSLVGDPSVALDNLMAWQDSAGKTVAAGLVLTRSWMERFLEATGTQKLALIKQAVAAGEGATFGL